MHALGSLAALVIVVGVGETTLTTLLHSMGDASPRVALGLADVVLSPLLYLGGAMLYGDQAARVGCRDRQSPGAARARRRREVGPKPGEGLRVRGEARRVKRAEARRPRPRPGCQARPRGLEQGRPV